MEERKRLTGALRDMDGTPYKPLGAKSEKGVGADCSGLLFVVAQKAGFKKTPYSPVLGFASNEGWIEVQKGSFSESKVDDGDAIQMVLPDPRRPGQTTNHVVMYDLEADKKKWHNIRHASPTANMVKSATLESLLKKGGRVEAVYRLHSISEDTEAKDR
ncbi:MAG: hypothetical protein HQL59_11490 [Magnetococcales bacterium]|nr:hypothetical protein [Magnetococcales bacterium]